MSNRNPDDEDLRDVFASLRAEDAAVAPPVLIPETQTGLERRQWKLRPMMPALAVVVAIVTTVLLLPKTEKPVISDVEFDELSELISRELFTSSAGNWTAPSDFLFEYSEPSTQ